MIALDQMTFSAQGDAFFPSRVNAPYSSSHDPGAIGTVGLYRDKPIPYGTADFDAPETESNKIAYLHQRVQPHLAALRAAGADDFRLHISYAYRDQCGLAYSPEEMRLMAELQCTVAIDCWEDDGEA